MILAVVSQWERVCLLSAYRVSVSYHRLGAFCQFLRLEVQYQHPVLFLGVRLCAEERGSLVSFPATRVLVPSALQNQLSWILAFYHMNLG